MPKPRRLGFRGLIVTLAWLTALPPPSLAPLALAQEAPAPQVYNAQQLDALLAPIALYPDTLLTQILMAAGSPLDIVQASRWLDQPGNKTLKGDALTAALQPQPFDPAVKSLVAFPQILAMLNGNLDWTQQLGYAFAGQQADVMASVQRLRRQARASGNLNTSPQQIVRTDNNIVVIEPANPQIVYVPSYSPTVVYGAWPYPTTPPVVLPPPPGYAIGTALAAGLAFGVGIAITSSLWNLGRPNWNTGSVNVNVNRYNSLAVNNQRITSNTFHPRYPNAARPGVRPPPPRGPVGPPGRPVGLPANAIGRPAVKVPASAVNRPPRSPSAGTPLANRPNAATRPNPPANRPAARPAPASRPAALSNMQDGKRASQLGNRGGQSRAAHQAARPHGGGARLPRQ